MKILHLANVLNPGGAERHLLSLVRGFRESALYEDVEIDIAYLKSGMRALAPEFEHLGCRVYDVGHPVNPLASAKYVTELLQEGNYQILHTHLPRADIIGAVAALGCSSQLRLVSSKHNEHQFLKRQPLRLAAKVAANRASHAIAISHSVRKYFLELGLARDPEAITVVHYGIDIQRIHEKVNCQTEFTSVDRSKMSIGVVARLTQQKGLRYLLAALPLVLERVPNCHAYILGDGEEETFLHELAKQLKIQHAVSFVGFQQNVEAWIDAMDILVLPSLWEGFGLVLLEAMALKKPVVASRVGPIPEVVFDMETGILVPPRDPGALAKAISQLSENSATRLKMGESGFARVSNLFTIDTMVDKTMVVYRQVLNQV